MATSPRTISQRIALEGAEELQRQLERIGQTGEDAFKKNADAIALAARRLESFVGLVQRVETAMSSVANASRNFGVNLANVGQALNAFDAAATRLVRNLALLAGGGGLLGAAAFGLSKFATSAATSADELKENAAAAGLTAQEYERLQFASAQAGIKQSQFNTIMGRVAEQFVEARDKQLAFKRALTSEQSFSDKEVQELIKSVAQADKVVDKLGRDIGNQKNPFLRFGVDVSKAGATAEEALLRVGDAMKKLGDLERAAAGRELFGARGGPKFAQFLAEARDALKGFEKEFKALARTEDQLKFGAETSDRLDLLSIVAQKAKNRLGSVFDQTLRTAVDGFTQAILRAFPAMEDFAKSVDKRVRPVVEDFIKLLNGDDANIQNNFIVSARDNFVAFGNSVKKVVNDVILPALKLLGDGLKLLAQGINSVFGTNLTATDVAIIAVIGKITGAFALLTAGARLAFAAVRTFFGAFSVIGAILIGLASIVGWPALAVAAFAGGATAIAANWERVREFFRQFGIELDGVEDKFNSLMGALNQDPRGFLTRGGEIVQNLRNFSSATGSASDAWQAFLNVLQTSPPIAATIAGLERLVSILERAVALLKNFGGAGTAAGEALKTDTQRDAENIDVLLQGTSEAIRQRARLDEGTRRLIEAELGLAQATAQSSRATQENAQVTQAAAQSTQAVAASSQQSIIEAAAAAVRARQEQQNLARAAKDSAPIFVEAGKELREVGVEGAQAAVKARQEQQNLARAVQGSSATLARDLATPFKTAQVEVEKLRTGIQSLGQAAAPAAAPGAPAAAAPGVGPFAGIVTQAQAAKDQILAIFQGLQSLITQAILGGGAGPGVGPSEGAVAAGASPAGSVGPFSGLLAQAQSAVQQILQLFGGIGQQLTQAIVAGLQGLLPTLQAAFAQIPIVFQSAINIIETAIQEMLATVRTASEEAIRQLREVVRAAQEAAQAVKNVGGRGFASGGYTGGGGTRRVAGVVHGGEYVQPARVVRQPGVLAFMEALRRTGDLSGVVSRFARGFDLGGLVPSVAAPKFAYASGGAVGKSGSTVNLFMPDGRKFALQGGSDTVRELQSYAVRSSYLSLGRKPSRHT